MEKHFILVFYMKQMTTVVAVDEVLQRVADGVKLEWLFVQDNRQVCKISIVRAALAALHEGLHATGLFKEIKLFEHVEW